MNDEGAVSGSHEAIPQKLVSSDGEQGGQANL